MPSFFVKPYRMPSEAMKPTSKIGERFLIWSPGGDSSVGDIVVFNPPAGALSSECGASGHRRDLQTRKQACPKPTQGKADVSFVNGVVAGPGDRLAVMVTSF